MTVTLPDTPGPSEIEWNLLDWGGELVPVLGGAVQRINRLGNRMALSVQMPMMRAEPDGRIWANRLHRGKLDGDVLFRPRQVGFVIGAPGAPLVDGATGVGTALPIKGLTPYYVIREGQPLSTVTGSRRYFNFAAAEVIADATGDATVTLSHALRAPLADNDVVEIASPKFEGYLESEGVAWSIDVARHVGLSFRIVERK